MEQPAASAVNLLIVDDHDGVRAAVRDWVSASYPGVQTHEARDAEEALRAAEHARFDIVLMDIGLPGINGVEATRQLHERMPETKIVMVSVHDSETQRAASVAAGAVAFVAKRRMHEGLRAVLDFILDESRARAAPAGQGHKA